jgi:hypothetical protein
MENTMKSEKQPLIDLIKVIEKAEPNDIRLLFVTRKLRDGISKTKKMLDKYYFRLYRVEIDNEIQIVFKDVILSQLLDVVKDNNRLVVAYEAIDDDVPKVYSYDILNRAIPFKDLIEQQINYDLPSIVDLTQFLNENEPWAYCIQVNDGIKTVCLSFTKFFKNKVMVDEDKNPEVNSIKRHFRARYNVDGTKLELLKGDTINFDRRIDCIYSTIDEKLSIFNKRNFEVIVEIEKEFRDVAQNTIAQLNNANFIEGLDTVNDELCNDPALHRRLYRLAKSLGDQTLDIARVKKMKATCTEFKLQLKISNGKVQITCKRDLDEMVKLLEDYYLESGQTGLKYGATVKTKL